MATSDWTDPGQAELGGTPLRRLALAMYRPPNNRVASLVVSIEEQSTMNDGDMAALLDHLASFPGMAEARLIESQSVSRATTPDAAYEPLPPVDDN